MKNKMIELEEVSFVYSGEKCPVWQGLHCYFKENKINLLLGPSGCGKSTLLYLLNGIVPHIVEGERSGRILLHGEEIQNKEPREMAKQVSIVFQDPESQFCTFTVEDEIAFGLENQNTAEDKIESLIIEALQMVGMEKYQKCLLSELSGGQKQKITIASALAMQSNILLLDEPTANLDAKSRQDIFDLLQELVDTYNKTIILVEHNLDGLYQMVEHAVVFNQNGEVILCGSGNEVFSSLLWDKNFWDTAVFLPEELLILRSWLSANYKYESVAKYCEDQRKEAETCEDGRFHLKLQSLQNLLTTEAEKESEPNRKRTNKSGETLLAINNLSFSYACKTGRKKRTFRKEENFCILKDFNLTIQKGDFLALVGPNGVGKSTLLSVLFKVYTDYKGQITINQEDLQRIKKKDLYHTSGLVFQNPEVQFVANDVYSELMFSLKETALTPEEKSRQVEGMLCRFHLEDCRERSPFVLSQGQKRRLSVAAMLLTGQEVLFLDEPTYGQDYDNQKELMELLKQLNQEGITIVIITHDMSIVAEYADKVALLLDGTVQFEGTPEELFQHADFVERGNLSLPGTCKFSKKLRAYFMDFPICYTKEACLDYLNKSLKHRQEVTVCFPI